MLRQFFQILFLTLLISLLLPADASAQKSKSKEVADATKTTQRATKTLDEIMAIPDQAIPSDLLRKANAIGVFPKMVKGAFIIGGQAGEGVISRRQNGVWGLPVLFNLGGASVGFQIGGSSTDVVMLFMTEESLKNLLEDKFEIGGEAAVAAGPVGRTAKASTDAQLQAQILSYSRSKGLFAGVSISGVVISPDNHANMAVYSSEANAILMDASKPANIPPAMKAFQQALTRYSK